ncbi:MAG: L,D-transpeptidase [Flavobacteriaceae bacterium]
MSRIAAVWSKVLILGILFISCNPKNGHSSESHKTDSIPSTVVNKTIELPKPLNVPRNIRIGEYFDFMDSLVVRYDSVLPYPLSEHLFVRSNPWILDTLVRTDYYGMMARDSFVYDQRQLIALPKGNTLVLPDSLTACALLSDFADTEIDINIPEFKLRIFQDSVLKYTFPVRVGQNRQRYLKMSDRVTDLRTQEGAGHIVAHNKDPDFYNPVDGKQFFLTKRDDGKTTLMPQIPWIETQINGTRNGQMIHPTTNPKTLGKAYSNGCIGTTEGDAWVIYYYAPLGTKIKIRYDLEIYEEGVVSAVFKDIYYKN